MAGGGRVGRIPPGGTLKTMRNGSVATCYDCFMQHFRCSQYPAGDVRIHLGANELNNPKTTLHDEAGAFDLPSIITGVVTVGVLTAGVLASIFGIIPHAQDAGTKQDLSAVGAAEGVSKTQSGAYDSLTGLTLKQLLPSGMDPSKIDAKQTASGGWAAAAKSDTGKIFLSTEPRRDPRDVTGTEACTPAALATPQLFNHTTLAESWPASSRPNGTYIWVVTALNDRGETLASDSLSSWYLESTQRMQITISAVPGAVGYKIYRSGTGSAADVKLLDTVQAPPTFEDPNGKYGTVFDWTDDGSLLPGTDAPPTTNTTGDAVPTSVIITDVPSALATEK